VSPARDSGIFQDESVFHGNELIDLERFRQIVDTVLSRFDMQGTLAGFKVIDLSTGNTLFDSNGDVLFNPASNMKIVSTSAALYGLGPEYRFTTLLKAAEPPDAHGSLKGDLFVVGRGDPLLNHENLERLASDLYKTGLRTIKGNIAIDDSFFDEARQIPGWDDGDESCYSAPMGALSVQFNTVWITVYPSPMVGRRALVSTTPKTGYFKIRNTAKTVRKGRTKLTIRLVQGRKHPELIIRGRISKRDGGGLMTCRKIDEPSLYAGWTLFDYLTRQGIRVRGRVQLRTADDSAGHEILAFQSPPLEELVFQLNKESNNFMAEQIFKTLGAEKEGTPGSWDNGIRYTGKFLSQIVGAKEGSYEIQNGSGLGMDNRVSADLLIRVLRYMNDNPALKNAFLASLPVMGLDGTLRNRHKHSDASNRIMAKTGFINNVMTLSGYVETKGCDKLAFSLLLNRLTQSPRVHLRKIQDEIILAMSNLVLNPANQRCITMRPLERQDGGNPAVSSDRP